MNPIVSKEREMNPLESQVSELRELVFGLHCVLNSLSERITGDQFTVLTGSENNLSRVVPELRRVRWHPSPMSNAYLPPTDLSDPSKHRFPEPCVVRRAIYEMPAALGWNECGLGPYPIPCGQVAEPAASQSLEQFKQPK